MNLLFSFRVLLPLAALSVISQGDVTIPGRLRLITPNGEHGKGYIEVFHEGEWGSICDGGLWKQENADVVCEELGFKRAFMPTSKALFGPLDGASEKIWLTDVNCTGTETSILECPHGGWGAHSCTHKDDAGVICTAEEEIPVLDYQGCFVDWPGNRLLKDQYSNRRQDIDWHNMKKTVLECGFDAEEEINKGKDYRVFAVQFFGECYSGEGSPDYDDHPAGKGGCINGVGTLSHNAVYQFKPYYDLGCWLDKPGNQRTMSLLQNLRRHIDWYNLEATVEACLKLAKDANKTYFAVQFYGECWASDDENFRNYGQATNCYNGVGASWSNYVYKIR